MTAIKPLPGETKDEAKLRAQQEARAKAEADRRASDNLKRKLYSAWGVWKICPRKPCRRACACSGEAKRCFDRFWPLVAEDRKVEFRAFVTVSARDKLPFPEACRHARAERARYLEQEAHLARQKVKAAETMKPADTVRFVPESRAPRVWSG